MRLTGTEARKFEAWVKETVDSSVLPLEINDGEGLKQNLITLIRASVPVVRINTAVRPPTGFMGVKTVG